MVDDLKIIKKHYGEDLMHLCRELFPTILESSGVLSTIIEENFYPNKFLYRDIVKNDSIYDFKAFVYSIFDNDYREEIITTKTPEELLKSVGYTLYECKTESDILKFEKYYREDEKLCTFKGDRLNRCYVFFAIKDNADILNREDFINPYRQDEYGTSVISIQFTKDEDYNLSIKNRYNHTVYNPDATYGNNLDNIIPGLTNSFENTYGFKQKYISNDFELPNYVRANDGKYYKYNYEIDLVYYCTDNVILEHLDPINFEKEKIIIMDYFILDLENKKIRLFDVLKDSFIKSIGEIKNISIKKNDFGKDIIITTGKEETIIISLDKENRIKSYSNKTIDLIDNNFLYYGKYLERIDIPNVEIIDNNFLYSNKDMIKIKLPKVKLIENNFMYQNKKLELIEADELLKIRNDFLFYNIHMKELSLPKLKYIAKGFMSNNTKLEKLSLPSAIKIGNGFMFNNDILEDLKLEEVEFIGDDFMFFNTKLKNISMNNLKEVGCNFLTTNEFVEEINFPNLKIISSNFFSNNKIINKVNLPKVEEIGKKFLYENNSLEEIFLPKAKIIREDFLCFNTILKNLYVSNNCIFVKNIDYGTGYEDLKPKIRKLER